MTDDKHTITISLSPAQYAALSELSQTENSDLPTLVCRGVDTLLAVYRASDANGRLSAVEKQLSTMHQQVLKLLVSVMKLAGQAIYFSSLPLTTGPVKARLNKEGVSLHWLRSEKFAIDLLKPPELVKPQSVQSPGQE